jgi:proteasome lid subunit RPN8/RPN11
MRLTDELELAIRKEGEAAYPNECCGVILGEVAPDGARAAARLIPVQNARGEGETRRRYEIAPEDFLKADREARGAGLDIIGIYHSHPDHPAVPSEYDLKNALPWYSYVIVSVENGEAKDFSNWTLNDDGSDFTREAYN